MNPICLIFADVVINEINHVIEYEYTGYAFITFHSPDKALEMFWSHQLFFTFRSNTRFLAGLLVLYEVTEAYLGLTPWGDQMIMSPAAIAAIMVP